MTKNKENIKNYLSSEEAFNEMTHAGYDYIKENNLIDLLINKEIKIHQNL